MPNFDYNAPAELFLAKPRRAVARNIAVSKQRLRPFVTPLRTYARPKPSERGLRSGMSASTAAKSNAYTKLPIIRCASLSDRALARVRNETDGAPFRRQFQEKDSRPGFESDTERSTAP
jgi:hypothetical protein